MIEFRTNTKQLLDNDEVRIMSLDVNISEPDEFNCIELHNSITEVAKIKNINDFSYHVDLVCGKGCNYIANVFRVLIEETGSETKASVIVKTLINITRKGLFSELHDREASAYNNIISKFINIQSDLEIRDRIVLPQCILTNIDKGYEVIILEDLLLSGFVMHDKLLVYKNLDYLQVKEVLIYLAKFHALSFIYKNREKNLQQFEELEKGFYDILYNNSFLNKSHLKNYFLESFEMSLNLIEDAETRIKLQSVKEKLLNLLRMYTSPRRYNAFCHGDCWLNNILFEMKENEINVCFVDFQTMRYANPITDILQFLYISTDSKFRLEHMENLKTCYFESFQEYLTLFNMETASLYPEEEFRKDFEDLLPYGLIVALIELRVATTNPDDEMLLKKLIQREIFSDEEKEALKLYQLKVNEVSTEYEMSGVLDKLLHLVNKLE